MTLPETSWRKLSSGTVKAPDTIFDAIEAAVSICDADDIAPIDTVAKIAQQGAHGVGLTEGLIIVSLDGRKWRVTAEEIG